MMVHLGLVLTLAGLALVGLLLLLLLRLGLVHLVEEGQAGSLELIGLLLELLSGSSDFTRLVLGNEFTEGVDLLTDLLSLSLVKTVLEFLESLLSVVQDAVGTVGSLNGRLALLVLSTILLSILNHGLDLGVGETGARGNGDGLVLVGGLVLRVDVDNGVSVNVEGDLDLRDTTVGRRNANKLEVSKELVVLDKLTLTLEDLDLHGSLEVSSSREGLRLLGRDGSVAVDQTSEDTTESLNTERQRGDVEEKNVSNLTGKDSTLDRSTNGNSLIGVDGLSGLTTEQRLNRLSDLGHTGHTTDEDDVLNLAGLEVGVLKGLAHGVNSAADERLNKRLELSTGHLEVDVLSTAGISSDERKVDLSLERRRQLNLGLLSSLTNTLDSHAVVGKVEARLLLELLNNVAHKADIEVLTTKVGVTVRGLNLENTLLNFENGDIEGTTTKIVDGDNAVSLLLKTVSKGSGGGFVNDTEDVETGDLTGVLGGLTLGVVEVGRDSNNSILDGLAEVVLSGLLHLAQNETTDLGRRVLLSASLNPGITIGVLDDLVGDLLDITLDLSIGELTTDKTLGGEQSVFRVDNSLALGGNTDETLAVLGESDNGGCCAGTFLLLAIAQYW
jgi:hypothetical protein